MSSNPLILNGSPHKDGHTMQVVNAIFKSTKLLHAYDLQVASCDDCKLCKRWLKCRFNDDMIHVIEALNQADHLVIASPIYFGALTDKLLTVINRLQYAFEAKHTHKKSRFEVERMTLILTAGGQGESIFQGAIQTGTILKQLLNATSLDVLWIDQTDQTNNLVNDHQQKIEHFQHQLKKKT